MVKVLPYPFFFALKGSYFTGAWNRFKSIKKEQNYVVMWWPLWEALQSRKHSSFVCLSLPRTPSMVPNLPHLMVIKSVSVVHVCIGKTPARLVPLIPMPTFARYVSIIYLATDATYFHGQLWRLVFFCINIINIASFLQLQGSTWKGGAATWCEPLLPSGSDFATEANGGSVHQQKISFTCNHLWMDKSQAL